jgi:hypothetical protein
MNARRQTIGNLLRGVIPIGILLLPVLLAACGPGGGAKY